MLKNNVSEFKNRLINNQFYKSIDLSIQQKIRKGDIGILYSNSELSQRAGIDPNYYQAIYNYLSQYVHAYPYALTQLMKFRAGDDDSLMILKTVLDDCAGYVCHAVRDFLVVMPDQKVNVDERAKSLMVTWEYIFRNESRTLL